MNEGFAKAASSEGLKACPLLFTSDWYGTLSKIGVNKNNFELLQFLSDAKQAGHRVIITSTQNRSEVEPLFVLLVNLARDHGYDIIDADQFEFYTKAELKDMNLFPDYSFDDESITGGLYRNYVRPVMEITVSQDVGPNNFRTWPWSLTQLREACNLHTRPTDGTLGGVPEGPRP